MLCLAEEVGGHPRRVPGAVVYYKYLAGARHHIYIDNSVYEPLCRGHIDISRPRNFIHFRNGRRAVGKGPHGLRPADSVYPVNARDRRRNEYRRVNAAGAGRRGHKNLFNTRHTGRYGVHQDGGGVGGLAARNVQGHPLKGRYSRTEHCAVLFRKKPRRP